MLSGSQTVSDTERTKKKSEGRDHQDWHESDKYVWSIIQIIWRLLIWNFAQRKLIERSLPIPSQIILRHLQKSLTDL
jgi:hypothetical protein